VFHHRGPAETDRKRNRVWRYPQSYANPNQTPTQVTTHRVSAPVSKTNGLHFKEKRPKLFARGLAPLVEMLQAMAMKPRACCRRFSGLRRDLPRNGRPWEPRRSKKK